MWGGGGGGGGGGETSSGHSISSRRGRVINQVI